MLDTNYSCCIIGNTSLLIRCAKILKKYNWEIKWIGTADPKIIEYCQQEKIQNISDKSSFKEFLLSTDYDFLFSIVNDVILDPEMVTSANQFAVNYHDALLPKYAGMHASFWALYHQEKQHGISWHKIDQGIDSGDILIQKKIDISKEETALSLHSKCYEQAVNGFEELIIQIKNNEVKTISQDLNNRSYNALNKRPDNACIINFDQSAQTIQNQINAFEFGAQYDNPIGHPKILIGDKLFIIAEAKIISEKSNGKLSSIDKIEENALIINTKDFKIAITKLNDIYGKEQSISQLNLAEETEVNKFDSTHKDLSKLYEEACKNEKEWVNKLLDLEVLEMPFIHQRKSVNGAKQSNDFSIKMEHWESILGNENPSKNDYLSLLILYLATLSDNHIFNIPLCQNEYQFANLFATVVPTNISIDPAKTIKENIADLSV